MPSIQSEYIKSTLRYLSSHAHAHAAAAAALQAALPWYSVARRTPRMPGAGNGARVEVFAIKNALTSLNSDMQGQTGSGLQGRRNRWGRGSWSPNMLAQRQRLGMKPCAHNICLCFGRYDSRGLLLNLMMSY